MTVHDYNSTDKWSRDAIVARYDQYARELRLRRLTDLSPREHSERGNRWIYPVMDKVIAGIEKGDEACIQIGIEFIEESQGFTFGRILKANTARALRRASLSSKQQGRIRKRVATMLIEGYVPREFKEYAKLLRKVGLGHWWSAIEEKANCDDPYVLRWYEYFKRHQEEAESGQQE